MKELTIEQKAKAYDKALEVLHKYDGAHIMFTQDLKEEMFPELAESEDERIRKELIHLVKKSCEQGGYALHKYEADRMLAWLEKQGEQNPTDKTKPKFNVGKWITNGDYTWSEEDEKYLNSIIKRTVAYGDSSVYGLIKDDIDWLKSLKERVQPQNNITDEELAQAKKDSYNDTLNKIEYHSGDPTFDDGWSSAIWYLKKRNAMPQKQREPEVEWNEKDEANLNEALSYIKDDTLKEFIKSLRPQKQWKPSEEQLKSLKGVIDVGYFTSYPNSLETLYEQLKQL